MCLPPCRGQTGCPLSGPQEWVLRRTVEQIVDCVPVVRLLYTSEPQMVDSVVDVLKILDHSLPGGKAGKATTVPWLFVRHASPRSSLPEPQVVEQLVEVPIPLTVTLADGKDDRGIRWRHVWGRSGGTHWWMVGTNHTRKDRTDGFTAGPGRYANTNTGQLHLPGVDVSVTMLDKFQQWRCLGSSSSTDWWIFQLVCVGAAQCTLCRGPWSSTGPVPWCGVDVPVVVQRQVPWPTLLVNAWLHSGYIFCVYLAAFRKNFTQFLREGGTQILKSILHPALSSSSGEVCTVDASVADELFAWKL